MYKHKISWWPCGNKAAALADMSVIDVKVQMLDLAWLYADSKNFNNLATFLFSKNIIGTEFSRIMLDSFWEKYKTRIFWKIFIPYIIYLSLTVYYFVNVVCHSYATTTPGQRWLGMFNFFSLAYQFYVEFKQACSREESKTYFTKW